MRIGIACHPSHGGSGVVATELGKSLAQRGHSVHFVVYDVPFRLGGSDENIMVHRVDPPNYAVFKSPPHDLALANLMAEVAWKYQLDVMHVHYAIPYAICALLAKQMVNHSFRLVTTLHGTDVTVLGESPSLKRLIEFGINQSDAVTAVSDNLVAQSKEKFTITVPVQRIYNFVDLVEYRRQDVSEERLKFAAPHEKILLHISNFRPVKRTKDVISIFDQIQKQIPAKLLLVGEGPEWFAVKQYVKKLGIASKVIFLGIQEEVARLYSLADLLLIPSEKESFGLVAIEAMACGVPVVGSNTGGLPEVVAHGETGLLSPVGDVMDMANNALRILRNQTMHRIFSLRGLERVKYRFSAGRIVGQYESLYRRLLNGGGSNNERQKASCSSRS